MQQTAYELRISDWCSDVCSSDLRARVLGPWPSDWCRARVWVRLGRAMHVGGADHGPERGGGLVELALRPAGARFVAHGSDLRVMVVTELRAILAGISLGAHP